MLSVILLSTVQQAPAFLRSPDIFGDTAVFTCEGDLWLGDIANHKASRLTRDVGTEFDARFSPDGKFVAYTGELDGIREVYVMPVDGGAPKRLTYLNDYAEMVDWKDSRTIVFRARNWTAGGAPTMFSVPADGGQATKLPLEFASVASFRPDGNTFVFNRFNRSGNAWFRYQGGLKNDLWLGDLQALAFKRIYVGKGSAEFPVWAGERIYFATYDGADFSLGSVDSNGGGFKRAVGPSDVEVRYVQSDGRRVVFERGLGIEMYDPATGRGMPLKFDLVSDLLHTRPYMAPADALVFSSSIGPTGKRVLAEARGQIISLGAKDGESRVVLAKDGVRYRVPIFSPDGKKIAYFSDETGEQQLYVSDADGQNAKQITTDKGRQLKRLKWSPDSKKIGLTDSDMSLRVIDLETGREAFVHRSSSPGWDGPQFDFSPDSNWIAFVDLDLWLNLGRLRLFDVKSGQSFPVSTGTVDDFSPTFSQDGKYLAFLSRRNLAPDWDPIQNHLNLAKNIKPYLLVLRADDPSPLAPKEAEEGVGEDKKEDKRPFAMDRDGLYGRFVEIPLEPGSYAQIAFAGDRLLVRETGDDPTVRYYDLKARKGGQFAPASDLMQVSADGKKVILAAGANIRVLDASSENNAAGEGKVGFAGLLLRIDPVSEWREMYWDAWRHIRDYFYVANMHGADWPAVGRKYAALLPSVRSRDELTQLLRWMLAEPAISHSFFGGGDVRSLVKPARPSFLGVDLEAGENGYLRITRILRGGDFLEADRSPLAAPGFNVHVGDYLIEVAGRPAKSGSDWQEGLLGRAGQLVAIKVNTKGIADGARIVKVKPIASEARMRLLQFIEDRRAYVDKASGGKIGYLYLRAMVQDDMADFIRQYYPQRGKDALIVDTRFNSGGSISDLIITVLKQRPVAFWNQRGTSVPWTRQGDFFPGPMACLINEFNYSDGEEFPFEWKALKLGPVIGRRTRGGEVGSDPGWPLADGGTINVPNYGMFTEKGGWEIEGPGVSPDIDVLSDPNAWARGKDPQLDNAIEMMLDSLRRNPVHRPVVPPPPVKIKPPFLSPTDHPLSAMLCARGGGRGWGESERRSRSLGVWPARGPRVQRR